MREQHHNCSVLVTNCQLEVYALQVRNRAGISFFGQRGIYN